MIGLVANGLLVLSMGMLVRASDMMVLGSDNRAALVTNRAATKRCHYSNPYSMRQVECADLNLREIPQNLQTNIQILDFSGNRLRELKSKTLSVFTSLAFLYLQDNFIQTIEEGAFDELRLLEVIDLTKNGCQDIPKNILGLPYLRKLFLSENRLNDKSFESMDHVEESSLQYLQLSNNLLTKLPSLGILPLLTHLNVSGNEITSVRAEEIAIFCSLKILDLTDNPIKFNSTTYDCEMFNAWIASREITMKPEKFDCPRKETSGRNDRAFPDDIVKRFDSCSEIIKIRVETAKARSTWILVASCVGVSLVFLFITLYCIHKRNNKKKARQRLKEQQQQQIVANNANTELLNSNLTENT